MDTQIIAFVAIMLGAIAAVVIPYLLKMREEEQPFNMSYLYAMILNIALAAFLMIPDTVEIAFKPLFALFLAGAGLQVATNKLNTIRIKAKQ